MSLRQWFSVVHLVETASSEGVPIPLLAELKRRHVASVVIVDSCDEVVGVWSKCMARVIIVRHSGEGGCCCRAKAGVVLFLEGEGQHHSVEELVDALELHRSNWVRVVESPSAYVQNIRGACERAPLVQCVASILVDARHHEDIRCTAAGVPLFAVLQDSSIVPGAGWILVLNPKYHDPRRVWDAESLRDQCSWIAWWIHPAFVSRYGSLAGLENALLANAPWGPLDVSVERFPIEASSVYKPLAAEGQAAYLHTLRDLPGGARDLLPMQGSVIEWFNKFFGGNMNVKERLESTVHYPCGPIFTTLHVHFRVGIPDEHEVGTGRIVAVDAEAVGGLLEVTHHDSMVSQMENKLSFCLKRGLTYRIQETSSSYTLLRSSDACMALFNGHTLLFGDLNGDIAHKTLLRSALEIPPKGSRFFVCVCGDSGSGKDTTLNALEQLRLPGVHVPPIVIQDPQLDGEYFALRARNIRGDPLQTEISWRLGSCEYGFDSQGYQVCAANVTRAALKPIRDAVSSRGIVLVTVYLDVSEDICAQRIKMRGRDANIGARVERNSRTWQPVMEQESNFCFTIYNGRDDGGLCAGQSLGMIVDLLLG